jgi:SAM-dependent methyltransferase
MTLFMNPTDWSSFIDRFARDRIPFLDVLVAEAAKHMNLNGLSAVTSDDITGSIGLYVARTAKEVVCCVAGVRDVTYLTELLLEAGVNNVDIRINAKIHPGGSTMFPFLKRRFDVALLAGSVLFSPTTRGAIFEAASILKPGGKLGLIVWSPVRPTNPNDIEDPANILHRRFTPTSPHETAFRFVDAVANAGFRNVRFEQCTCRCEAPSGAAYLDMLRSRITTRVRSIGNERTNRVEHRMATIAQPIALESWAGMVFAEAPDVPA